MSQETRGTDGPDGVWNSVGRHAGWGMTIALSIGLFLWLGLEADRRLGTLPLLTIVGAFVGAAGGFYSMIRHLVLEPRDRAARSSQEEGPTAPPSDSHHDESAGDRR